MEVLRNYIVRCLVKVPTTQSIITYDVDRIGEDAVQVAKNFLKNITQIAEEEFDLENITPKDVKIISIYECVDSRGWKYEIY